MSKPKIKPKKKDLIMSPRELFLYREDVDPLKRKYRRFKRAGKASV